MAVLRKRNITIVQANIKSVFHALNDICSVGGGLVSAVVDNGHYQYSEVYKLHSADYLSVLSWVSQAWRDIPSYGTTKGRAERMHFSS